MKRNLLVFVFVSMVGCEPTAQIKRDAQPNGMTITMNVPASKFEHRETAYPITESGHRTDITLTMSELHLGSEWAPFSSFCLYKSASQTHVNVCLQFFYSEREGLIQPRHLYKSAEKEAPSIQTLIPRYKVNDPIAITLNDTGGTITFFVNGELMFSNTEVSSPEKLRYSCSSAVCNFDFQK